MRKLSKSKKGKATLSRRKDRGVALIAALLLLLLFTGMSVAMVISTNSDMLITRYYSNSRGAFYAADSGLTIARRQMVNQLVAAGSSGFSATTQPIPAGTETTVKNNVNSSYGSSYTVLNTTGSYPESFEIDTTVTSLGTPTCTVIGGGGTCAAPTGAVTGYSYIYPYALKAYGRSSGNQVVSLSDSGSIKINVSGSGGSSTTSFAAFGMFIDQYSICSGGTLVPGTITGPVFTNGSWTFGTSGSYIFTDSVGSAGSNFGYQFSGKCDQLSTASDKSGSTTISPTFQNGYNLGQPTVPLPVNDYNQKQAVLDGKGAASSAPTNANLNAVLKNVSGTAYPSGGTTTGVYLPYSVGTGGVKTFTGGGIYVEGDAKVTLSPSGTTGQTYTIVQGSGSSAVTTTITIDTGANTTTMTQGGTVTTITGVPQQLDPVTSAFQRDATMLYVDGNITGISGPAQGQAAINDSTALTVVAKSNVTVTGDILYKTEPVTQTQNQIPNTPADTLIPGNDHGQVLGIFTSTGNIQLANSQSNGNLEIDASIATISNGGSGGLVNTGNAINTLNIVGGRIQNQIMNINTTTRNVFFDRRFAQNNFSPPWYPSTTITSTAATTASYVPTVQRLRWVNNSVYY